MKAWHRIPWRVWVLITILGLPFIGSAEPVTQISGLEIGNMFDSSQAVLVGTVDDARLLRENSENGPTTHRSIVMKVQEWEATIRVLRVYKGNAAPVVRVAFAVQIPATSTRYGPSLDRGETDLLFLVSTEDGKFAFANPQWAKFRLSYFAPSHEKASGSALLEKDLDGGLTGSAGAITDALDILMTFRSISDSTERDVAALSASNDVRTAAKAQVVLLGTGKNQYYAGLNNFLSLHGADIPGEELASIFGRVDDPGPDADPKVFASLSELQLAPSRLAAMLALRKIHSPESIPTLIGHLDDPDANIQHLAVITLNEIVGYDVGPSVPEFKRNPQMYINRWKQWWDQEGKAQYSP